MFEPANEQMNCASASGANVHPVAAVVRTSVGGDTGPYRTPACQAMNSPDSVAVPMGSMVVFRSHRGSELKLAPGSGDGPHPDRMIIGGRLSNDRDGAEAPRVAGTGR